MKRPEGIRRLAAPASPGTGAPGSSIFPRRIDPNPAVHLIGALHETETTPDGPLSRAFKMSALAEKGDTKSPRLCQTTIARSVHCHGVGLHTGLPCKLNILPAAPDSGIVFVLRHGCRELKITARVENVVEATLATTLGGAGMRISTVEHLMAAFAGLGIDNARVELDAAEIPVLDGSAEPFIILLKKAGITPQAKPKNFLIIKRPVSVSRGDCRAMLMPGNGFQVSCTIDFPHPMISNQFYAIQISNGNFEREISPARTFGFLGEYEMLRRRGLARGGTLENAILLGRDRVINPAGLRYPDEFVRHKILDAVGDLWLLGGQVIGHFIGYKSGHHLNHALIRSLLEHEGWREVKNFSTEEELAEVQISPPDHFSS
jgi:UDP-3-O-[3-hydroxymyristoyl] N-acetylglucosamine deacetylase